jgi:hypothetical protein
MLNDADRIAGALTVIPFEYDFFNTKAVFGCAVDLMVHKSYRKDITVMKKMYDAVTGLIGDDIDFLYAVPNPNSYQYFLKILGWHEIGKLNYYLLPLHVSKLFSKLKALDFISKSAAAILNGVKWPSTTSVFERPIAKNISPDFLIYRYPPGHYTKIETSGKSAYYTTVDEASTMTAYIIDAWPLTAGWLSEVTRNIWRNERQDIDLILYVGTAIPFVYNLFKAPIGCEPRSLHLIGKVLKPDKIDKRINQIKNWQFNLSDLDVR